MEGEKTKKNNQINNQINNPNPTHFLSKGSADKPKGNEDLNTGVFGKPPRQPPSVVGKFEHRGDVISFMPTTRFFITMNPSHACRTELREILKTLSTIHPNLIPTCENMALEEGVETARVLKIKFVKLNSTTSVLRMLKANGLQGTGFDGVFINNIF